MVTLNQQPVVLAVDDNPDALYALEKILCHSKDFSGGYKVVTCGRGIDVLELAKEHRPTVILLDVMMPSMDGYEVIAQLKQDNELKFIPIILVTARSSLDDIICGLDSGADDYITKPFRPEELLARLRAVLRTKELYEELHVAQEQNALLMEQISEPYNFSSIIGSSSAIKEVLNLVEKVLDVNSPVLITGASGTGKELIARAIHYNSPRRGQPFVAKNCAAFSESLLESELFGHTKGAFTGAIDNRKGLFSAANKGTLFLDEIGEMAQSLQAKLLRVLQEGSFMPVGSVQETKVDVRVVAATNRNLLEMVQRGKFREDLYYRLNVVCVDLPSLKERVEDIPLLVQHFINRISQSRGLGIKTIHPETLGFLCSYDWPGNVRELENEVERLLIVGRDALTIMPELLSPRIREKSRAAVVESTVSESVPKETSSQENATLRDAIEDLERAMLFDVLNQVNWNKSDAARRLGISRSNLTSKVQQYGLNPLRR